MSSNPKAAGIIGNLLEHYDRALYGLLVPFIAPQFFNTANPTTLLILGYSLLPLGLLTRPLGSLAFGWIGDSFGRKLSLFYSLLGMAICTFAIGCLPDFSTIGSWAPILLLVAKMAQSFFAAGETSTGAVFVLEHTKPDKRGFASSFYDASSIAGVLVASAAVTLLCYCECIESYWRVLFWLGGLTGIFGIFLRKKTDDGAEFKKVEMRFYASWKNILKEHKQLLCVIALASGFSHAIYTLSFTFMNAFIPLVTPLSQVEAMQANTGLLFMDLLLLPCFGYLAQRWGKERVMLSGLLLSILSAVPLFYILEQGSFWGVFAARIGLVTFGVAFAAPYYAWAMEKIDPSQRCSILAAGSVLGSQLLGAPTTVACLWLYEWSGMVIAPAFYLVAMGSAVLFSSGIVKDLSVPFSKRTVVPGKTV